MRPADIAPPAHLAHLRRDARGYPVLAVVGRDAHHVGFRTLSEDRKLALACFDWCAVCGLPFRDAVRWLIRVDYPGSAFALATAGDRLVFSEAPMHEVCALYAAQVCPWLLTPTARFVVGSRAGIPRTAELAWCGFANTEEVTGTAVSLEDHPPVFGFVMGPQVSAATYTRTEIGKRYQDQLAGDAPPELAAEERRLVALFADTDQRAVGVTLAAAVLGMAFVDGYDAVLTDPGEESVRELADAYAADPRGMREVLRHHPDPDVRVAAGAAFAWERHHADRLPAVLETARGRHREGRS